MKALNAVTAVLVVAVSTFVIFMILAIVLDGFVVIGQMGPLLVLISFVLAVVMWWAKVWSRVWHKLVAS